MNEAALTIAIIMGIALSTGALVSSFLKWGVPYLKNKRFRPHVHRDTVGVFNVRAWTAFGRVGLSHDGFRGQFGWFQLRNEKNFQSLEDATQAYEIWEEANKALVEKHKAAGVVHRF